MRAAMTVDALPRRRAEPILASPGAAGAGSPRLEVRSLHVDDAMRRARSAPPAGSQTACETAIAQQAFGVCPGSGRVRQLLAPSSPMTRAEVGSLAMAYGDIDGVVGRRRGAGAPPPVHGAASARRAAASVEAVDIDAHSGRRHGLSRQDSAASWDLPAGDSTSAERRKFFDHTCLADRHATLLGRPRAGDAQSHAGTSSSHRRERSWQSHTNSRSRTCSASRVPAQEERTLAVEALLAEVTAAVGGTVPLPVPSRRPRSRPHALMIEVAAIAANAGRAPRPPPQVLVADALLDVPLPGSACGTPLGSCCMASPAGGSWSGDATTASGGPSGACSWEPSPLASPAMSDAGDEAALATEQECAAPAKVPLALQRVMAAMCSGAESSSLACSAAAAFETKRRTLQKESRVRVGGRPLPAQKPRRWQ